ncbi:MULTISPECIES: universal stress protein [unclassified Legionella]|uniref:universal stress protein n=1 Tax=unclassified Legionella TaxID=2622702 RepID=UPI00105425EA|nr:MULTISPECIES: universal stress protein [unclassified Legionella]MDI9817612.1 universal stress protein [Legionella sp. PL877]
MQRFHNILFVSHGIKDEQESLKQAIKLSHNNQAQLSILIVCPPFPDNLQEYQASYEESLIDRINKAIKAAKAELNYSKKKLDIKIEVESGSTPDIRIIRHIIRQKHDLLIKEIESVDNQKGFKALDMELLRKCPSPVLLYRPFKHSQEEARVGVAIDPNADEPAAHDLAVNLLELSYSLMQNHAEPLHIISCWNFIFESYLRDNVWVKTSREELDKIIANEKASYARILNQLIEEASIGEKYHINQLKGDPQELIPSFITDKEIDILVMGTVARTGISGFIIGNTAENILQKIDCSLLALKPQGFVSPVKAY